MSNDKKHTFTIVLGGAIPADIADPEEVERWLGAYAESLLKNQKWIDQYSILSVDGDLCPDNWL